MLGAVVLVTVILGYALLVNRITKWPLESSFLFVSTSLVCLLFFSGLADVLSPISVALLATGVLLCLAGIFSQWKRGSLREQISPGVVFFLVSAVGIWMLTHSSYYANFIWGDDFSHWGRVSKIIASSDRLINTSDAVLFKDYPPGTALFNYLFFLVEPYSESLAMFAQGIFVLTAVSHLFVNVSWGAGRYVLMGVAGFMYFLFYVFGVGLHTLCADLALGVIFGAGLFGYLGDRRCGTTAALVRLIPVAMVLPLIKPIGIFFSVVIVSVVLCDLLLRDDSWANKLRWCAMTAVLACACMATYIAWGQHVKNMNVGPTFATTFTAGQVAQALFSESATERQKVTVSNFIHRLATPIAGGFKKVNMQQYLLLLSTAFVLYMRRGGEAHRLVPLKQYVPIALLYFGFALYLAALLVLYLFSFGEYEGTNLASFDRYANTYLLGLVLVCFGLALSRFLSEARSRARTGIFVILCVLVIIPSAKFVLRDITRVAEAEMGKLPQGVIEDHSRYWNVIEKHAPPASRIYFLWQNSRGMELLVLGYKSMPRTFNSGCWSLGEPYDSGDVWTCRLSTADLEATLKKYDFLFIGHSDKKLDTILSPITGEGPLSDGSLFEIFEEGSNLGVRRVL